MKIYYYKHRYGNVGDDLNPWLWPQLLPSLFQGYRYHGSTDTDTMADTEALFIGIGTLLNAQIPQRCNKAVFGTGTGYGEPVRHDNARYYAVRGPLTAQRLGLDPALAITDAAALIATLTRPVVAPQHRISLMPHHGSSEESTRWAAIAARLDINYINPAASPDEVIDAITASELVITEAMHGAILADTLRVPWMPFLSTRDQHEFKWQDWCASLRLCYEPTRLHPLYRRLNLRNAFTNYAKQEMNTLALKKMIRSGRRYLSHPKILQDRVQRLGEQLEAFRHDHASGYFEHG